MTIDIIMILIGLLIIFGQFLKWKFLSDPSPQFYLLYTHSAIKRFFGRKFLKYFNYILGSLFIIFALVDIFMKYLRPMVRV